MFYEISKPHNFSISMMQHALGILVVTLITFLSCSQERYKENLQPQTDNKIAKIDSTIIIDPIEILPEYQFGTNEELIKIITSRIKYPQDKCIEGTAVLSFIVDINGNVNSPSIKRSICKEIDAQLIHMITDYKFIPGKSAGKIVETQLVLPIKIKVK